MRSPLCSTKNPPFEGDGPPDGAVATSLFQKLRECADLRGVEII